MAIKFRRIKAGQVVGFQTINELYGNDASLQAQIDASSERLEAAETELGDLGDRVLAAEGAIEAHATELGDHGDRLDALETTASSLGQRMTATEGNASSALMIAQSHTPTLANHGNRISALEAAVGSSDRYLASGHYKWNENAAQYELQGGDPNGVLPAVCPDPNSDGSALVTFSSQLPTRFYGVSVLQARAAGDNARLGVGWVEKEKDHLLIEFIRSNGEPDATAEFSLVIH